MMHWLGYGIYIIATRVYYLLLHIAAWFHPKARLAIAGRKNWQAQLRAKTNHLNKERIWFHCASLGEYEQARPVIELLRKNKPNTAIVVSFFSPSGYEVKKNDSLPDVICYLPFDTANNATEFLSIIQPSKAVFVRYEFWYHYLHTLKKKGIPVYLISAHFVPVQIFFKWYGAFYRHLLRLFSSIFCQYDSDIKLLESINIKAEKKFGDTRFDRVKQLAANISPIEEIELFKKQAPLLVLGSSYEHEEQMTSEWLKQADKRWRIIVAPHEISPQRIEAIESVFNQFGTMRYSQFAADNDKRVLIIDNIGMLSRIYAYADVAFVGGGFGRKGLHNILEPLAYGCPVMFGPKHKAKFPESHMAESQGIACTITNHLEMADALSRWLSNEAINAKVSQQAKNFIEQHSGISATIYQTIAC